MSNHAPPHRNISGSLSESSLPAQLVATRLPLHAMCSLTTFITPPTRSPELTISSPAALQISAPAPGNRMDRENRSMNAGLASTDWCAAGVDRVDGRADGSEPRKLGDDALCAIPPATWLRFFSRRPQRSRATLISSTAVRERVRDHPRRFNARSSSRSAIVFADQLSLSIRDDEDHLFQSVAYSILLLVRRPTATPVAGGSAS